MSNGKKRFSIIQGEDRLLTLRIVKKSDCDEVCGDPYSLASTTEISAIFKKLDKTNLVKKLSLGELSIVSAEGGKIQISLSDVDTLQLAPGKNQDFAVVIENGAETREIQFDNCLEVIRSIA